MSHDTEVAFDRENNLVLHEGCADWHTPLDPEPYVAPRGTRWSSDGGPEGRYRFAPRPGYSQNKEDYA